jgi:uridine kinase
MAQLSRMNVISIGELESQLGVLKLPQYICACEQVFQDRISQIAEEILQRPAIQAVFVSGPTASGKTTFSDRLARALTRADRPTRVLSLDDYYRIGDAVYDDQGRPDFESITTLDTEDMVRDFTALFRGESVQLPTFDFVGRCRILRPDKQIRLRARDLLVIEGLHGLSEQIAGHLPREHVFGVFIMPWCSLLDGRQLLGSRDLRILRRISRDVLHRGSTALSTIDYWPMIDHTEQLFFPDYLARADVYINSCLPYEFCIVPPLAAAQIRHSLEQYKSGNLPGSIYRQKRLGYADLPAAVAEAGDLVQACARLPAADRSLVPADSILQEFIH